MASLSTLTLFVLAAGALVAIPGPNHLYIVAQSLAGGRRAGYASAFGVEAGTLVHILLAAAGLSFLIAQSAVAFTAIRLVGAAYLVYLGVRTLLRRSEPDPHDVPRLQSLRRVFLDGLVVNVLNPKVILFFLAFLPQFVDPAAGAVPLQVVVLGLALALLGLVSDLVYAAVAGTFGGKADARSRWQSHQRIASGLIYLGLGAVTAFAGSGRRQP